MKTSLVCGLLVFALFGGPAYAQSDADRAAELARKNSDARGGLDRLKAIESLTMKGRVRLPAMGSAFPITIYQ